MEDLKKHFNIKPLGAGAFIDIMELQDLINSEVDKEKIQGIKGMLSVLSSLLDPKDATDPVEYVRGLPISDLAPIFEEIIK
jgi:hypothetical protein